MADPGAFVENLYLHALGRLGSRSEVDGWTAVFDTPGLSQAEARPSSPPASNTARRRHNHLVQSWYATYLGREAVGGEEQGFVNELLAGQTEEQVSRQLLAAAEFYNRRANAVLDGDGRPALRPGASTCWC